MKQYLLFSALIAAIVGCASVGGNSPAAVPFITSAQNSLNHQHYQQALESATLAINADSSNYLGYYLQAQAYQHLNQKQLAYQSYQKAISLTSQDIKPQVAYANLLCADQNYSQAAIAYNSAFKTAQENHLSTTAILIANGDCLTSQNQLDAAIDNNYSKALQDESAPLSAYLGISYAYVLQRNYATAYYYMTLYHGGDNIQSLQMKTMALSGLLNSNLKLNDRGKLQATLNRYQSQLQQLTSNNKSAADEDVLMPLDDVSVTAPSVPPARNKVIAVKNASLPETQKAPIAVPTDARYPTLTTRIKTSTSGRHYVIVEKGDTLYNLALRSKMPAAKLLKINNIQANEIQIGRRIYLD